MCNVELSLDYVCIRRFCGCVFDITYERFLGIGYYGSFWRFRVERGCVFFGGIDGILVILIRII